ncbi:MAG: DNA-protecting protein DprA [Candidatus Liptonbacteria bacterium]|nr:DNA-protecting protein DprA [Candidatus Liptonbacteria bacterium]
MDAEIGKERVYCNAALIETKSNYRALKKLKDRLETWENVWTELSRAGATLNPETELQKLEKAKVRLILADDPEFPPLLREIPWPPFGIYVLGELPERQKSAIGIVGTRKASEGGVELARTFAVELSRAGVVIVSGLAFGIDAASHKGCLEANGTTIAVLGNGLDAIYPASNEKLGRNIIASGGALISEYPLGTPSLPQHFIERNRLISGLSLGIVVIEAPKVSGALATARFAFEQNREVFVVPGPANHKNFHGSHQLLRNGARLATQASEILEDLNLAEANEEKNASRSFETNEEKVIFEVLENSAEPLEVDKIIEMTHLESRVVNGTLTLLLVKNLIRENNEGYGVKS